jgi:acetolactate synthase-1/3 small subunit
MLVKVKSESKNRAELLQIGEVFRAKVVSMTADTLMFEISGDDDKIGAFFGLIEPFGVIELARTGRLALKR